jgi:flagellar biosynthesis GTPase FlhF
VLPHVAISIIRGALDAGVTSAESAELLDWCEIAVHVCRQKRQAGQVLRNSAGLLVKIIKDPETRSRIVSEELEQALRTSYRRQQDAAERQHRENVEKSMILEYEHARMQLAEMLFQEMPDAKKAILRKQKAELLRQQERFQRISPEVQEREIDTAIVQEIARKEAPPYEKWRLRKQAQQAVLAFGNPDSPFERMA